VATDKTTKTRPRSKSKAKSKASTTPTKRSSTRASSSKESFASLTDQLRSAFEREAATSNILRVIASSPSELQIVMDTIAENAARLCEADDVLVRQTDGVTYKTVSHFGSLPHSGDEIPVDIGSGPGRAILERRTVHVHDIQEAVTEFPGAKSYAIPQGIRTALAVPMLRESVRSGSFICGDLKSCRLQTGRLACSKHLPIRP